MHSDKLIGYSINLEMLINYHDCELYDLSVILLMQQAL
jgi:hypothetical protein